MSTITHLVRFKKLGREYTREKSFLSDKSKEDYLTRLKERMNVSEVRCFKKLLTDEKS